MHFFVQEMAKKHGKLFIWKISATTQGKGVVDGVKGKVKSISTGKLWVLKKKKRKSNRFNLKLASEFSKSTKIIHITKEEIIAFKGSNHLPNPTQSMEHRKCMTWKQMAQLITRQVPKHTSSSLFYWNKEKFIRNMTKTNMASSICHSPLKIACPFKCTLHHVWNGC